MADSVFHILYTSAARELFSSDVLEDLLIQSRDFNAENNITGLLLYCDGSFMQLLEGQEADVTQLYSRIRADTRHRNVVTMVSREAPERWCQDWAMAFYHCRNRGEIDACINLAAGIDPVSDKLGKDNPLRKTMTGFAERNLRQFDR